MKSSIYKEIFPEETVNKIRKYFLEQNILITETLWSNPNDHVFSCRIEIDGSHLSALGKGKTEMFCLASAYGELMEELLSGLAFNDTILYPKMIKDFSINELFIDNEKITLPQSFSKSFPFESGKSLYMYWKDRKKNNEKILCGKYYNLTDQSALSVLPIGLINMCCGSNGICAGNSEIEALDHGFSEIMERYITKKIYKENPIMPTIPSYLLKDLFVEEYEMICSIEKNSKYKVIVKDCTFGGLFPVMGIILIDTELKKYAVNLGADPDIRIALQRCLTEIFQGDEFFYKDKMNDLNFSLPINLWEEYDLQIKNGSGKWNYTLFLSEDQSNYSPKIKEFSSFNEKLIYWKELFSTLGIHDVYIRDCSSTIINVYQIFIPGYSEVFLLSNDNYDKNLFDKKSLINNLVNLDDNALITFSDDLKNYLVRVTHHRKNFIQSYVGLEFDNKFWDNHTLEYLLIVVSMKLKNKKDVKNYIKEYLKISKENNSDSSNEATLLNCVLDSIELDDMVNEKFNESTKSSILSKLYGKQISDFCKIILDNPSFLFSQIQPIICDACDKCSSSNCEYKKLSEIFIAVEKMKRKDGLYVI